VRQSFAGFPGFLLVFDLSGLEVNQSDPQSWLAESALLLVTLGTGRPQPQYVMLPIAPSSSGQSKQEMY